MKPTPRPNPSSLRLPGLVLGTVVLAGCSTISGWFDRDDNDATAPAALTEYAPTVTVTPLWSAGIGDGEGRTGTRQGPAIADGRVYAAGLDGGVRAFDLQSGAAVWHFPAEGLRLAASPGVGDGLVVVGGLDGVVLALDAATGAERWRGKVGAEVTAAPAIAQGAVLVRSDDGRLTAFDAASGERRWFWAAPAPTLTVRGADAPVLGPGYVFAGNDDGTLVALALQDGRALWQLPVAQQEGRSELERMADVDGTPVLDGTTLLASSYREQTVAVDAPSGRPLWSVDHGGAGRIGVGADKVVVADRDGIVWGLDKATGSAIWQQDALARRNLSGVAVLGDHAVVGDFDGYLHWLQLSDGALAARVDAGEAIRSAPRVADGILVVQDIDGRVSAYQVQ
ncbi:MAG TPA: outer membrane protein assembly factor BamB [Xanthomonadaceae bacterium]|nr:outer membrane protein assembly factor BamB [Xanthomonadaceae bacterium]